jgi:hypothetical protein
MYSRSPILATSDWKSEASMLFGLLFISEVAGCRRPCYKYCSFYTYVASSFILTVGAKTTPMSETKYS